MNGKYSGVAGAGSSEECIDCPPGYYCAATVALSEPTGACDAGFFCPKGQNNAAPSVDAYDFGDILGGKCPLGYYCEAGTKHPVPCPIGMIGRTEGLLSEAQCTMCPPGYYCDE